MAFLTKRIIAKLRRTVAAIQMAPGYYMQSVFPDPDDCGAACCFAGWVIWLHVSDAAYQKLVMDPRTDWQGEAEQILGISNTAYKLFGSAVSWPEPFSSLYYRGSSSAARAKVLAARIEHYIATDGRE